MSFMKQIPKDRLFDFCEHNQIILHQMLDCANEARSLLVDKTFEDLQKDRVLQTIGSEK